MPVEPDASRGACPVRRRLVGVILLAVYPRRVIPTFYPMASLSRGDRDKPRWCSTWAVLVQSGCEMSCLKSRPRGLYPIGTVQRGSAGDLLCGDVQYRSLAGSGVRGNTAGKSSTRKGPKGLPSESGRRRVAELGQTSCGRRRGNLLAGMVTEASVFVR